MRLAILLVILGIIGLLGSEPMQEVAKAEEARMSDPIEVVSRTCAPAASPLCRCIVDGTVRTLQAGPREILAVVQRPGAVWNEVVESVDARMKGALEQARASAETTCRDRIVPGSRGIRTMDRMVRNANPTEAKQSLRASCASDGGSSKACACYEQTLAAALGPQDFDVVRKDARFPPRLEDMPADRRHMTLAAMASARTACGVGGS